VRSSCPYVELCSLPEVMGDAGVLVDPLDVEAIADGIQRLVQTRSCERSCGKRALRAKDSLDETAHGHGKFWT